MMPVDLDLVGKEVTRIVRAVFCHQGRVFTVLEKSNLERGLWWVAPGGKVEKEDESDYLALGRELKEELGVDEDDYHCFCFRPYFVTLSPFENQVYSTQYFINKLSVLVSFRLLVGQASSGWFGSLRELLAQGQGQVSLTTRMLFERLRSTGYLTG